MDHLQLVAAAGAPAHHTILKLPSLVETTLNERFEIRKTDKSFDDGMFIKFNIGLGRKSPVSYLKYSINDAKYYQSKQQIFCESTICKC